MNPQEYNKQRELFFSIRNELEESLNGSREFYYYPAQPIERLLQNSGIEHMAKEIIQIHKKHSNLPLWYFSQEYKKDGIGNEMPYFNFRDFEKITKEIKLGLFSAIRSDVIGPYLPGNYRAEDPKNLFKRKLILIPRYQEGPVARGYVRFPVIIDSKEKEESMSDLRELDKFFKNN